MKKPLTRKIQVTRVGGFFRARYEGARNAVLASTRAEAVERLLNATPGLNHDSRALHQQHAYKRSAFAEATS